MEKWDDYLSTLDDKQKRVVLKALNTAMKLAPEADPGLLYGVPGLKLNKKPLVAVAAHNKHYGIYPFSPKVVSVLKPLLKNPDTDKGTIRFSYEESPSDEFFSKLIELRKKEIM